MSCDCHRHGIFKIKLVATFISGVSLYCNAKFQTKFCCDWKLFLLSCRRCGLDLKNVSQPCTVANTVNVSFHRHDKCGYWKRRKVKCSDNVIAHLWQPVLIQRTSQQTPSLSTTPHKYLPLLKIQLGFHFQFITSCSAFINLLIRSILCCQEFTINNKDWNGWNVLDILLKILK